MNKPFFPTLDPKLAEQIAEAVAYLEVPAEALLVLAYRDLLRQVEARRRAVQQELDQTVADGHAALARILLNADDLKVRPASDYFNFS